MQFEIHNGVLTHVRAYDVTELIVPEGVTHISGYAFAGCPNLRSLQLPATLRCIESAGLKGCKHLERLILPAGLRTIGRGALARCSSLREAVIPEGVEALQETFAGCWSLERVLLPHSLQLLDDAFIGCDDLAEIVLPPQVRFPRQPFRNCDRLRRVEMHAGSLLCTEDGSVLQLPACEELILHGKAPRLPALRPSVLRLLHTPDMDLGDLPACYRLHSLLTWIRTGDDPTWPEARRIGYLNYAAMHLPALMKHAGEEAVCRFLLQHELLKLPQVNQLMDQLAGEQPELAAEVLAYRSAHFTQADMLRLEEQEAAAFERSLELALHPHSDAYLRTQWAFTADGLLRHYKGVDSTITLPVSYKGKAVTATARRTASPGIMQHYRGLRHVVVPASYTALGENFLAGAELETLTLPVSLQQIHPHAFSDARVREIILYEPEGCASWCDAMLFSDTVEKLTVQEGVTRLPSIRFVGNPQRRREISLPATLQHLPHLPLSPRDSTTWHISADNPCLHRVNGFLLSADHSVLYEAPVDVTSLADLAGRLREIAGGALSGCTGLTELAVPDGVQRIGPMAFASCPQLRRAKLPRSVKVLGDRAFVHCDALEAFHAMEGLDSLGEYAFCFCRSLRDVHLPWTVSTIGRYAFSYCRQLRHLHLPLCLKEIPEGLIHSSFSVQQLTVPQGTRHIHPEAFRTSMLAALHIPRDHSLAPGTLEALSGSIWCVEH